MSNSGFGSGTGNSDINTGSGTSGTGLGAGTSGTGFGTGTTGTTGDFSTSGGFNTQSANDAGTCAHCGQSLNRGGLEQFLGRLGITDDMVNNLRSQFANVDIDEYLDTARTYLKDGSDKATTYAKENPGKVAAGVAALALGAGLLYAATHRDKS
jgi:hypothetical protein